MSRAELDIQTLSFEEDGITVAFMQLPTDVRMGGRLAMAHQMHLSAAHPDYAEDMEAIRDRVKRALRNALEDFEASEPHVPEVDPEDDDDERGMGE